MLPVRVPLLALIPRTGRPDSPGRELIRPGGGADKKSRGSLVMEIRTILPRKYELRITLMITVLSSNASP